MYKIIQIYKFLNLVYNIIWAAKYRKIAIIAVVTKVDLQPRQLLRFITKFIVIIHIYTSLILNLECRYVIGQRSTK